MDIFVAFLRGMNLGRRRVKNDELRACFLSLGFEDVAPFLASGNVIFGFPRADAGGLQRLIEVALEENLGYPVPTYVRTAEEVRSIGERQPFSKEAMGASAGRMQVGLLSGPPAAAKREAVLELRTPDDQLAIHGRELYWLPKGNMSASDLDLARVEALLGQMTVRTHRTITRLAAKLA